MATEHVTIGQLRRRTKGSFRSHEELVEVVRLRFVLSGLEPFPIYTGGVPRYLPGGELVLRKNPHQIGIADLIVPFFDLHVGCGLPFGRMAFVECKTGNARRSPAQVKNRTLFESYGFLCLLVRRQEDVDPLIETHRKARRFAWLHPQSR